MAVYTDVSDADIRAFAAQYDVGDVISFKGIAEGIENTNFVLQASAGRFILTLYERRVDPADLPYFLGLMEHLSARGVPCPVPVSARDGNALRALAGRPAALFTWLDGLWPQAPDAAQCRAAGTALAAIHGAGRGFSMTRRNALSIGEWPALLNASRAVADDIEPGLAERAASAMARVTARWPRGLPSGHIHADLFPDNVFFSGETITGLIDFYFACQDALAYDLAITLNAWVFDGDGAWSPARARAMIGGYEAKRPLTPMERAALPTLCAGAALRFFLTRLYDWARTPADALVVRKDPMEYWRRACFHADVGDVSDYGLTP